MDGDPLKVAMLTLSSPTFGNKNVKELKSLKEEEPINETDPNIIKTKEQVEYEEKIKSLIQDYLNKIRERLDLQLSNFLLNNDIASPKVDENITKALKQI